METKYCKNCSKASFYGERKGNEPVFKCKSPFCIMEPIVPNIYRDIMIQEIKNVGKNTKR
jgi:hypothetical protein